MGQKAVLDAKQYPVLAKYTRPLLANKRHVLGREYEIREIKATLARNEVSNVCLLGPAGSGKTAIVEETARTDQENVYLSVDLSLMSSAEGRNTNGSVEMASRMKRLVDEVVSYQQMEHQTLVLFMDEFHLIAQVSTAALQAIKPLLAESGRRHVKIIAATTLEEFDQYIKPDEALTERLQRITVEPPSDDVVVEILRSMQKVYAPKVLIPRELLESIVEETNRFLPAQAQPRKSLLVLDAMLGWYNEFKTPLNFKLLKKVMYDTNRINIQWSMDVHKLESYLNSRVFDQDLATKTLARRLYISVADLNDPTRPQGSFLFTGSTGVGKTELAKALTYAMFHDERAMIRFDMSEYARDDSVDLLRKRLTEEIWARPYSVLLLDEIEKASGNCTRLLLQVLDDGRLTDAHGRSVSFCNCYVVLTTNAAADLYKKTQFWVEKSEKNSAKTGDSALVDTNANSLASYGKLIRANLKSQANNRFPVELLGRLDAIVPFSPLSEGTLAKIAKLRLSEFAQRLQRKHQVTLVVDASVIRYLVKDRSNVAADAGGARDLKRIIDDEIISAVSQYVMLYPDVRQLACSVQGKMACDDPNLVKDNAHIIVGPLKRSRRRVSQLRRA